MLEIVPLFFLPRDASRLRQRVRARDAVVDTGLLREVLSHFEAVQRDGDEAVRALTRRFDGVELATNRVPIDAVERAVSALAPELRAAIDVAHAHIEQVNLGLLPEDLRRSPRPGTEVGERYTPLASAAVWVPARKGPLLSTALMLVGAARAAGVTRIAVATPPSTGGGWDPSTLAAARVAGAHEFYVGNGVALIAAFSLGTASVSKVDAVFGPGPPAIAAAMGLSGCFGLRSAPGIGPTDCLVLASDDADPHTVCLDLMSEAEHGTDSAAVLVTPSTELANAVAAELVAAVPVASRREILTHSFGPSGLSSLVVAPDWDAAVAFSNEFAAEHVMLVGREAEARASELRSAGELLLGPHTPFAAANYAIGVTAVLPTNGLARCFSGITARDFLRMTTFARLDASALASLTPTIAALAASEGLPAHAEAVLGR